MSQSPKPSHHPVQGEARGREKSLEKNPRVHFDLKRKESDQAEGTARKAALRPAAAAPSGKLDSGTKSPVSVKGTSDEGEKGDEKKSPAREVRKESEGGKGEKTKTWKRWRPPRKGKGKGKKGKKESWFSKKGQ